MMDRGGERGGGWSILPVITFVFKDFVVFLNFAEWIESYEGNEWNGIKTEINVRQAASSIYLSHHQHYSRKIDLVVYSIVDCVTNCGLAVAAAVVVVPVVAVVVNLTDRIWASSSAYVVHVNLLILGT